MRILFYSTRFFPEVGGIEECTRLLAEGLSARGHTVTVATETPSRQKQVPLQYEVIREPTHKMLYDLAQAHDVSIHGCISLRKLLPFIASPRPRVAIHHTWYSARNGETSLQGHIKLFLTRLFHNVAVSAAVAATIPSPCKVISNPYDNALFTESQLPRGLTLLYVGRLVSDKGVSVLLRAFAHVREKFPSLSLSIVGDGPERIPLEELTRSLNLTEAVSFKGVLGGEKLAASYREHRIVVLPSLWQEPFGIVALEALASGCAVIGTVGGGLPDAIGACGRLVSNGNIEELAHALIEALSEEGQPPDRRSLVKNHLALHTREAISSHYESLLTEIVDEA